MGCRIQVNYTDIKDLPGYGSCEKALKMLKDNMVDYLATDAHNASTRSPAIKDALAFLYSQYPSEYVDSIIYKQ